MAKRCYICDKGTTAGRSISHAHNVSKRQFAANLHKVRVEVGGAVRRVWVCTRCRRSGRIVKPAARDYQPETS